jgi:ribosome-binding protein aMBF1 (putative translation factor)
MVTTNRFQKGSGCFKCELCGKLTRSTGRGDNELLHLCKDCYDKSSDENAIVDGRMTQKEFNKKWVF